MDVSKIWTDLIITAIRLLGHSKTFFINFYIQIYVTMDSIILFVPSAIQTMRRNIRFMIKNYIVLFVLLIRNELSVVIRLSPKEIFKENLVNYHYQIRDQILKPY